jgi:hypothetical protein
MPDREKVIKGIHDARRYLEDREWVDKSVGVHIDALNDALALLKEYDTQVQYRDDHIAEYEKEIKSLNKLLKEQEAVVRCKDCKHYDPEEQRCGDGLDGIFAPDWFCADGERKEGR